jgi:hypothetical protein
MPDDPLAGAREQAEQSKPPVRAAALLRIARVQTAFDREQARHTFEQLNVFPIPTSGSLHRSNWRLLWPDFPSCRKHSGSTIPVPLARRRRKCI